MRMLRRYHQRGDLLRFLEQPEVEPTNNRVERMLRPAVHRKELRGGGHDDAYTVDRARYFAAFAAFVREVTGG